MSEEERLEKIKERNKKSCCNEIDIYFLLNLIEKQQKEIERFNNELDLDYVNKNFIPKDKIREKMQEYYEKANPYDCDTADYKQSQEIGGWNALRKLLEE